MGNKGCKLKPALLVRPIIYCAAPPPPPCLPLCCAPSFNACCGSSFGNNGFGGNLGAFAGYGGGYGLYNNIGGCCSGGLW